MTQTYHANFNSFAPPKDKSKLFHVSNPCNPPGFSQTVRISWTPTTVKHSNVNKRLHNKSSQPPGVVQDLAGFDLTSLTPCFSQNVSSNQKDTRPVRMRRTLNVVFLLAFVHVTDFLYWRRWLWLRPDCRQMWFKSDSLSSLIVHTVLGLRLDVIDPFWMILLGKFKFPASVYQWDVTLFRLGLIIDPHDKLLSLRRWSRDVVQRGCDIVCDVIILGQTAARVVIQVLHGAGLDWSYSISPHTEEPIRFLPCFYCFCHLQ